MSKPSLTGSYPKNWSGVLIRTLLVSLLFLGNFGRQKAFGQKVEITDSILVNYQKIALQNSGDKAITCDSTILSLEVFLPKNVPYSYQIKGIDTKAAVTQLGYIRYTNLTAGDYKLTIWTANGVVDTLNFRVKKPFWQSWWFWPMIGTYLLALAGIGSYLFFLYDFRQKLRLAHVRNSIAADLHDEVGSNLTSIAIFAELIRKKAPHTLFPLLDKITDNAEETVQLMQDTVWAINPRNDSASLFIEKISAFAVDILSCKGIELSVTTALKSEQLSLDMEQRKNCYLIAKEAINNVAKHSQATKAVLSFTQTEQRLNVLIEDNGIGFDMSLGSFGNGLVNFRKRSENNDIEISIESAVGKGTKIRLTA